MLKKLLLLLPLLYSITLFAQQQIDDSKISPRLKEAIQATPNDYHDFYILLADQVDTRAMDHDFYKNNTNLQERTYTVINALKAKAIQTQQPILDFLNQSSDVVQTQTQAFWITNVIFTRAKPSTILQLSQRSDIGILDLNVHLELSNYTTETTIAPPVPNGIESGLAAINAPAMWQLGYTGYGRKALVIDTGVDPTHPALKDTYWGNVTSDSEAWNNYNNITQPTPFDCGNHGTHVTGTVLGLDRSTKDTIGVAFNAHWMGAPALCGLPVSGTVASFQWAIDPDGDPNTIDDQPDVINNSWYDPSVDSMECNSIYFGLLSSVEAVGIGVIFAAGNFGPTPMTITPPTNINWDLVNVFGVAAVNGNSPNLPIASFSSRGPSACGDTASLLIKPEVAAPGQNVRSCVPGDTYSNLSGTSMASPHVAGAFLLLKQAFPYLTGTEIKLALYFNCNDLGIPGEDNTYGMGIIDVEQAFQYLVNQGNIPESPLATVDVILKEIHNIEEYECNTTITPNVEIINSGNDTLTSANIVYTYSTGLKDSVLWSGSLATFESTLISLPTTNLSRGEYSLDIVVKMPNGTPDSRDLDNHLSRSFFVADEELVTTIGDTVCIGGQAVLEGTHSDTSGIIRWHTSPFAGNTSNYGNTYITPPLSADKTYYADLTRTKYVGKTDTTNGTFHKGLDRHLVFDAHRPFKLKSVKVYADSTGGRIIELRQATGANILIKPVIVQAGEQRINLNFNVPRGQNLQLGLAARNGLYRSDTNVNFPYAIDEAVTIKGTNATNPSDFYYYFYDWEIEYTNVCGRTPTEVEVLDSTHLTVFGSNVDTVNINTSSGTVFFQDSTINAVFWHWDFGDGNTSNLPNPNNVYAQPGVYTVILRTKNSFGCSDIATKLIFVEGTVSTNSAAFSNEIKVFPNPSNGQFNVQFDFSKNRKVNMTLLDVLGRKVRNYGIQNIGQQIIGLNLNDLGNGIYYLRMEIDGVQVIKRLVKL